LLYYTEGELVAPEKRKEETQEQIAHSKAEADKLLNSSDNYEAEFAVFTSLIISKMIK